MSIHQGTSTKISITKDLGESVNNIMGIHGTKDYIVTRRIIVDLTTAIIRCSNPITAVITTDELSKYEQIVRQITRDGMITSVEFAEMDGATVNVVGDEDEVYEFEEEDLDEIKDSLQGL